MRRVPVRRWRLATGECEGQSGQSAGQHLRRPWVMMARVLDVVGEAKCEGFVEMVAGLRSRSSWCNGFLEALVLAEQG